MSICLAMLIPLALSALMGPVARTLQAIGTWPAPTLVDAVHYNCFPNRYINQYAFVTD
ncbi:MAG: hypothetical protein Tsb0020_53370 [Haliangiales bacterium]